MSIKVWLAAACGSCLLNLACSNPPAGPDYGDGMGGGSAGANAQPSAGNGTQAQGGTSAQAGSAPQGGSAPQAGSAPAAGSGGQAGGGLNGALLGHPDPNMVYPTREGFTLTLVEEFEQPLDLVADPIWTYSDGGLPEGQVRFAKDAITFEAGKMKITASTQAMPGSASFAENGQVYPMPRKSGEFRSKYNNFRYGRYEARFKAPHPTGAPGGDGNLINTLFVFRTPKVEDWREIDIEVTGDSASKLTTNMLWGNDKSAWEPGIQEAADPTPPAGFDSRADFHTYAFEWTDTQITWFIDDQQIRQKTAGAGLPIPEKSVKIMMNLWVFNDSWGFGGPEGASNVYPMVAEYEWFRFYKWNNEPTYPCLATPGCLSADDTNLSKNNAEETNVP